MTSTRWIGFGLWALSAICLAAAIGFGVAAADERMDRALAVAIAMSFGVAAEISFWAGGAALGLSFFMKRNGLLRRLFARKPSEGTQ